MMNISPTTTVRHSLIGNMVIHCQEFLLHFILDFRIRRTIIIGNSNSLHQVEISTHLHTHLGQHIFVPIRYNAFISFRSTYHKNRYPRNLAILIGNLIEIIFLADSLYLFIRYFTFCIVHVTETLLQQFHLFLLRLAHRSQFDIRLQQ